MRRLAILIPLVVGALAASATPESTELRAAARGVTFSKPVAVSANAGQAAAEPSIRAARNGNLYIVAPQGLGSSRPIDDEGGDIVWRSTDGGKNWTFLGSYDDAAGGGDADIAPDRSGDLWGAGLTLVNTTATYSTDDGDSWTANPVTTLDSGVDRQWIDTYRNEPFAFMSTGTPDDMALMRLELAGSAPIVVNQVSVSEVGETYQWPGEIAVDSKRSFVYVAYNNASDSATDEDTLRDNIIVTRTNLDLTETKHFVVAKTLGDSFDSFVAVDTDRAGNVYAVWTERRPKGPDGKRGVTNSYISVSNNKGKTWSAPKRVNKKRARTTAFPWVVAGSRGRVAVTYYGTRRRGPSPEEVTKPTKKGPNWKVFVAYTMRAGRAKPFYRQRLAVPKPIHAGNVCTSGTGCAGGTRDLLDYFQIDLDPCGRMVIAYTDNSRDEVTIGGDRVSNSPELVSFVGQSGGKRFYRKPLNARVC